MFKTMQFLFATSMLLCATASQAEVLVYVDKSRQEMVVMQDHAVIGVWPVSTARPGKVTPNGKFTPYWLNANHRSSLYNGAPMPHSIFFTGNIAVHGTDKIEALGTPASAGCVRLHPDHAHVLYDLVQRVGMDQTRIVVE